MAAAIDRGEMKGVGKTVVGQCPNERNDDVAVNDAFAETAFGLRVLVEVNLRRVLIEPGRGLMLGFLEVMPST